jgi:4-amino-4-deoxy-L-arabinose transferase-like glycosyltransferase
MIVENYLLIFAITLHLASAIAYISGRTRLSLFLLFAGSFALFFWGASLDHFLNDWDERFHALVGSNLAHHPLIPTLIDKPVLPYDKTSWYDNHIWLHKQPLFLWQIALSISIFGVNELAVRLPSVILSSFLVLLTYRIGTLTFNQRTGYIAAILISTSYYIVMLISGDMGIDHDDISFMFYITASIWAWIEYEQNPRTKWILAMGVFSGAAILCKWLTGIFVFGLFGFSHLVIRRDFFTKRILIALSWSIGVCILVVAPWQIYIHCAFPIEAAFEQSYSARHFTEVIENHQEHFWFYIDWLKYHYRLLQAFIFIGIAVTLLRNKRLYLNASLLFGIFMVYIFFTLAATKMANYVIMVMPIMFIFMAVGFDVIIDILSMYLPNWAFATLFFLLLTFMMYQNLGLNEIRTSHERNNGHVGIRWQAKNFNRESFIKAAKILPGDYVIIWVPNFYEAIECMFYTGHTAYGDINKLMVNDIKKRGKGIAVFQQNNLPDYLQKDTSIYHIPYELKEVSLW